MQTTLLGLAVAMILALVAALVGPLFIHWDQYRSVFEAQATRLVGMPVRIKGGIEARLLPTPSVVLRDLEIGPPDEAPQVRARSLAAEFALGPLLRGRWHASEVRIDGPQFGVGLDRSGHVVGLSPTLSFDPDRLSIERLVIEDGRASFSDAASGTRLSVDKLRFKGEVRSLAGPFKGEGAFVSAEQIYGYQVTAGRRGEDGGLKLRLNIDPADRPLTFETEGTLWVDNGAPRFEGGVTLTRPVGVALASGKTLLSDPWRATSRIKASPSAALLEQVEFQYGGEDRAVKLTGTAEVKFGRHPRLDGILTARQVDLDRAFGAADARRRPPLAVLQAMAASIGTVIRPPIAVRLGIGIDAVTLGGATLQTVRGDFESADDTWKVDSFEFRAPGLTQVKVSGRLQVGATSGTFIGPADIEANDPKALVAWIEGRTEQVQGPAGGLHARGNIMLARDRIAINRLQAEFDRKTFTGRVDYTFASPDRPARLDAALSAAEFDFDSAAAFATAAFANTKFDRPGEVALALDVGRATLAGVEAKSAKAKLRLDASGLQIERLSVADLGGAALTASGLIDTSQPTARGAIRLDLDAQSLDGVAAIAARFAPQAADVLRASAGRLAPAKFDATLNLEATREARTGAKFRLDGRLGALRVAVSADADGEFADPAAANVKFNGRVDADDGSALAALLRIDRVAAIDKRPGRLAVAAAGTLGGDLHVQGQLSVGGFQSAASGTLRLADGFKSDLDVSVTAADVPAWHPDLLARVPVDAKAKFAAAGRSLTVTDLTGTVAGTGVRGRLALVLGQPLQVDGRIDVDAINAAALLAAAIGMPQPDLGPERPQWSSDPFRASPIEDLDGQLSFEIADATFTPHLAAKDLRGTARFGRASLAFENLDGIVAEGRLTGQANFTRDSSGVATRMRLALTRANAAALIPSSGDPPLSGRLTLQIDAGGAGLSPAALVGSLNGTGRLVVEKAQIAGFDPGVFDSVTRAVERGLPSDAIRVGDFVTKALDTGRLAVERAEAPITLASGQLRVGSMTTHASDTDLALVGTADLTDLTFDMRFTYSGASANAIINGHRPELSVALKGPVSAPKRTIDVSMLVGWLTLRSVEEETKRLQAIEAAPRDGPVGSTTTGTNPPSAPAQKPTQPPALERAPNLPPPIDVKPAPGTGRRVFHPSSSAADNRLRPLILFPQMR